MLAREPESQAIVEQFTSQGIDLETLIVQALGSSEYKEKSSASGFVRYPPPSVPALLPLRDGSADQRRVAVLVRSHVVDEKFEHLWSDLNGSDRRYDIFPVLNRAMLGGQAQSLEDRYPGIVWNEPAQFPPLGLHQTSNIHDTLWLCGDFPLILAALELPDYDYYVLVEYDVHFPRGGTAYMNRLVDRLLSSSEAILDGVGLEFSPEPARPEHRGGWAFFAAAAKVFPRVHHFYFPFVVLSRRGVAQVFAQRQLEAVRLAPHDEIVICEAFVPSSLMAANLSCVDLNTILPQSYTMASVGLQHVQPGRLSGQPLSYALANPYGDVEMTHGVYSDRAFLERNLALMGRNRSDLDLFASRVSDTFGPTLDGDLVQSYLAKARAQADGL